MRRIILSVAYPLLSHFFTLAHNGTICMKTFLNIKRIQATGRQHRGCITPQAVTHSLVLMRMGKIIARNLLSWLELIINRYCCI